MRSSIILSRRQWPAFLCAIFLFGASVAATAQTTNRPPSISGTPTSWVYVGSSYSFRPSAWDREGATLSFSIANKPSWASFSTRSGSLRGTPAQVGLWNDIRISVSDGNSSVALPGFSIRATSKSNDTPTISGAPATSVAAGSTYSFQASASDPNNDPLRFSISNRPVWASFNGMTGHLSGTPTAANAGSYPNIIISVTDGARRATLPSFTITVGGSSNRTPTITGSPTTSVTSGQAYDFKPSASDPDNNALGFSIQNRPSWAAFSTSSGQLSGTPTTTNVGTFANIIISVSDGKATAALPAFSISVNGPANSAPVISGTPLAAVNAGSVYSFRPAASDPNGDTLSFSVANLPSWASFSAATGQLSGTPSASNVGSYANIVISVSDGRATAALPGFAITVADVSIGNATLSWTPPTQNTDGSSLTNLAGYRIYYGASAGVLTQTVQLSNAGMSTYVVQNLSAGTYYFAVRAYTSDGVESDASNVTSKVVR
jgi:hypothetical protein